METPIDRRAFASLLATPFVLPAFGRLAPLGSLVAPKPITPPSAEFLKGLPRMMEIAGVPGVAIGVVKDGRAVWSHHEGLMDSVTKQPVSAETMWPAASLSKPVFPSARCISSTKESSTSTGRSRARNVRRRAGRTSVVVAKTRANVLKGAAACGACGVRCAAGLTSGVGGRDACAVLRINGASRQPRQVAPLSLRTFAHRSTPHPARQPRRTPHTACAIICARPA